MDDKKVSVVLKLSPRLVEKVFWLIEKAQDTGLNFSIQQLLELEICRQYQKLKSAEKKNEIEYEKR